MLQTRYGSDILDSYKTFGYLQQPATNPDCMLLLYIPYFNASSKVVISFLNRANPFSGVCLFCISVRNKIYVLEIEMFGPVVVARNLYFL